MRATTRPAAASVVSALSVVGVLSLFATGCGSRAGGPSLAVEAIEHWPMPPAGAVNPGPRSVAIGRNDTVVALDTVGRVLVHSASGELARSWSMPDTKVGRPEGVAWLRDGRLVVCDTHYHRVIFFSPDGDQLGTFGRHGTAPGEFIYPVAVTQDPAGDLYIAEYGSNDRVQKFTAAGEFVLAFGSFGTGTGQLQRPSGLAWHDGSIYVADAINNRVLVFADTGEYRGVLGGTDPVALDFPYDITVAGDGTIFIVEYGAGRVTRTTVDGKLLGRYGRTGSAADCLSTPWGLAVDSRMRLRVADTGNRRIVGLQL